jgi:hypothetical protein
MTCETTAYKLNRLLFSFFTGSCGILYWQFLRLWLQNCSFSFGLPCGPCQRKCLRAGHLGHCGFLGFLGGYFFTAAAGTLGSVYYFYNWLLFRLPCSTCQRKYLRAGHLGSGSFLGFLGGYFFTAAAGTLGSGYY